MQNFKGFLSYARQQIPEVEISGLHYVVTPSPRKNGNAIGICFDFSTNNPAFFGTKYTNAVRQKYLGMLYERLYDKGASFIESDFDLDFYTHLKKPHKIEEPASVEELKEGTVDVTKDNEVKYVNMDGMIHQDDIETGSSLERYCSKYGLSDVLMHGFHIIAPDPGTVDTLEAVMDAKEINSVIEFGGGVGTSGVAAKRRGLTDFTFVDLNKDVCKYLGEKLHYPVVNSDVFDFKFDRYYDVAILGVPYELNPALLEKKGQELADHAGIVILQAGCAGFFQFEHEWVYGVNDNFKEWPWFKQEQTLPFYFDRGSNHLIEYQTMIIAGNEELAEIEDTVEQNLKDRGAKPISYNHVK